MFSYCSTLNKPLTHGEWQFVVVQHTGSDVNKINPACNTSEETNCRVQMHRKLRTVRVVTRSDYISRRLSKKTCALSETNGALWKGRSVYTKLHCITSRITYSFVTYHQIGDMMICPTVGSRVTNTFYYVVSVFRLHREFTTWYARAHGGHRFIYLKVQQIYLTLKKHPLVTLC